MYVIYVCCRQIAPPQGAAPDRLLHASAAFGPATVVPVPPGNGESICACTKPHIYIYTCYIITLWNILEYHIILCVIIYIYIALYYTYIYMYYYISDYTYVYRHIYIS